MSATSGKDPILNGVLQSDLNAAGFKITNLDLPGTGVTSPPTIQHTTGILKGDNTGNAIAGVPKTDFWDTTVFLASGTNHAIGLVPDPGAVSGTTKFLREDSTWQVPAGSQTIPTITHTTGVLKGDNAGNAVTATAKTDYWDTSVFVPGGSHAKGLVPDPGGAGGTTKFLREDATFAVPPAASGVTIEVTALVIKGDGAGGGVHATSGTFTGDYVAPSNAVGRLLAGTTTLTSAGGATTINWNSTTTYKATLTENTTYTFSNATDGWDITVAITNTGSNFTVTWPASIRWTGGVYPTQTVGAKTDLWGFKLVGTQLYGAVIQNMT